MEQTGVLWSKSKSKWLELYENFSVDLGAQDLNGIRPNLFFKKTRSTILDEHYSSN
jgi:hypothetical protein